MAEAGTIQVGKSIEKITILSVDPATNQVKPVVLYKKKGKKGGSSKMLKPLERLFRQETEAGKAGLDRYLSEHAKSNANQKDGWLRDLGQNVFKATKTWNKKMKEYAEEDDD